MRLLAELAGRQLGQKVLVENRGGAGGTLAMPVLQQAAPDGYTIAQMPQPVLPRALDAEGAVGPDPRHHADHPDHAASPSASWCRRPARCATLDDLFAFARAHPGELTIATNGVGTTPHVVMDELFARAA